MIRFIGIPWQIAGRDLNGVDCGGLVMLASRVLFGIEIPDMWEYDERNNLEVTHQALADIPSFSDEVEVPQDGDIIAFELKRSVHFALFVKGRMLHIVDGGKSHLRRVPRGARYFRVRREKTWV